MENDDVCVTFESGLGYSTTLGRLGYSTTLGMMELTNRLLKHGHLPHHMLL